MIEAVARPEVRGVVLAVALLGGIDALEEYFGLLAHAWGVAAGLVPLAVVGIPVAGAAGALFGRRATRLSPCVLSCALGAGVLALVSVGILRRPVGLVGVAAFYGIYRLALVVVGARLQERMVGSSRATVSSVASVGTEVVTLGLFGAWALGGVELVTAGLLIVVAALPGLLRSRGASSS